MSGESLVNFTACVSALWLIGVVTLLLWLAFSGLTWAQRWQLVKRACGKVLHVVAELFLVAVTLIVVAAVIGSWVRVLSRYLQ